MVDALKTAGFRMVQHSNASIDGLQAPLIERADGYFRTARRALLSLVRIGLLPTHFKTLFNRLSQDCDAFIEADRARLITTSYHWSAEKPMIESSLDTIHHSSASSRVYVRTQPDISLDLGAQTTLPSARNSANKARSAASSDTAVATPP